LMVKLFQKMGYLFQDLFSGKLYNKFKIEIRLLKKYQMSHVF